MDWLMNGNGEMFAQLNPNSQKNEAMDGASPAPSFLASGLPLQPDFVDHLSGSQQVPPRTANFASEGKIFDKPSRKISEIRVFYDDGTFETFSPK